MVHVYTDRYTLKLFLWYDCLAAIMAISYCMRVAIDKEGG